MTHGNDAPASLADRRLSPDEAQAYLEAPITDAEREDLQALVAWFTRRYPTPLERLAYARRAYPRWQRNRGLAALSQSRNR